MIFFLPTILPRYKQNCEWRTHTVIYLETDQPIRELFADYDPGIRVLQEGSKRSTRSSTRTDFSAQFSLYCQNFCSPFHIFHLFQVEWTTKSVMDL